MIWNWRHTQTIISKRLKLKFLLTNEFDKLSRNPTVIPSLRYWLISWTTFYHDKLVQSKTLSVTTIFAGQQSILLYCRKADSTSWNSLYQRWEWRFDKRPKQYQITWQTAAYFCNYSKNQLLSHDQVTSIFLSYKFIWVKIGRVPQWHTMK